MADELSYTLELWTADDQHVDDLLARISHIGIARAAYGEAVRLYPARIVKLSQGARIVEEYRPNLKVVK
jgi:hypothetical protein